VREIKEDELHEVYREDGGELITFAADTANQQANARLIAAAPDLLAALKELVNDCDGLLGWNCDPAKRAIAKAEGRHHADA
jgi:hypothetical protein